MVKKVLILGSAALKIGEAGEFDYSGSQAIKALKEEGIKTILVNPNIATIQTSDDLADEVYFLPVNAAFVEKVIQKTRPDGILLGFGGQTALNTGLELHHSGILQKYDVQVLGSPLQAIIDTEDRARFVRRLREIGVQTARSQVATNLSEALAIVKKFDFPVIIRIAYALGGLGSAVCRNPVEFKEKAEKALSYAPQILIEEYLEGWKEIEYEVMCDRFGDCLTVCNMENLDPMGIHTGESIVVAPSQTLTNREYHKLRTIAIRVIQHLGIVGECNIQYALDPRTEEYRVIEVNARLSRSSALASKATGYPIAFVAAKLALGYGLHELPNKVTRSTTAFFEPALDYVVVKIPRWDLKKFRLVNRQIGSGMKSVGEVMAIGRTFAEALQKGLRMLETGALGVVGNDLQFINDLEKELREPTEERIFAVVQALETGYSVERINQLTHIDGWFLRKIRAIVELAQELKNHVHQPLPDELLKRAKQSGFSDRQIAHLTEQSAAAIHNQRVKIDLHPHLLQIDTLAAEFPAVTNYLYLSYNTGHTDIDQTDPNTVIVLGSGAYRIGSSVEFDWSCVNCGKTLRRLGYKTVMLNYNPETVSTDYDESDYLVFDEINFENVVELYRHFQALGVVVSMGGQIPNNLALKLHKSGIRILGTSAESIDRAENRRKFSDLLDQLMIDQPIWQEITSLEAARQFARQVDFPVLIRPSYVLSGAAMAVASNDEELSQYLQKAVTISPEHPTVISKFLENAKEIEYDAVAQNGNILIYAISEHVENAGVHSGDATLVLPPQRTYLETVRRIRLIARKIAKALNINGPFNIQFIAKQNEVKVIECNLRASRSFPFVSKVLKKNFIEIATEVIMRVPTAPVTLSLFELNHVGVKAPQFSFTRLQGADPTSGVEMASTGEVACLGDDFDEAFLKALISVGYRFPIRSVLVSTGAIESKAELLVGVQRLQAQGVKIYATHGTAHFLQSNGVNAGELNWPLEQTAPNVLDFIRERRVDLVINIPKNYQTEELTNGYLIRRTAADFNIMLITNRQIAMRLFEALGRSEPVELKAKPWGEY